MTKKKLSLRKESLKELTRSHLNKALGGGPCVGTQPNNSKVCLATSG